MKVLRDSIKKVGILVPLTVYKDSKTGDFTILDGQRRWTCAKELNLDSIPANEVAEPTLVWNIITMFQIHKLRMDWELMPTALKLELLINEVKDKNVHRLSVLTSLNESLISRCMKLLSFPRKFQDLMLDPDPKKRINSDFFIELYPILHDRNVNSFPWFKKRQLHDHVTVAMLKKYEVKGIKSITDFRIVKQYINNAVKAKKKKEISKLFKEFTDEPSLTPDYLNIESARTASNATKLTQDVDKLLVRLKNIDTEQYYGQNKLWEKLEKLSIIIRDVLKKLGRGNEL